MSRWILLLLVHVVLLVLAATDFTAATAFADGQFRCQFYRYATQRGWGAAYAFPYTLPVVLTNLAAYATGLATFVVAWRRGMTIIGAVGMLISAAGFASFAFELTHWLGEHNNSWIASAPAALIVLTAIALVQNFRRHSAVAGAVERQSQPLQPTP